MSEFNTIYQKISGAKSPIDIFGKKTSKDEVVRVYHLLAKTIHPDRFSGDALKFGMANDAFKTLNELKTQAIYSLENGTYETDSGFKEIEILTKKNKYVLVKPIADGDVSQVYEGKMNGNTVAIKISKNPANNDLLVAENEALKYLHNDSPAKSTVAMEHINYQPLESFEFVQEGRTHRAIVYPLVSGMVTVEDVLTAYPGGIDVRDAAWMINRILLALTVPHQSGYVHGAVVPNNFWLDLPTHNGILHGWGFSVKEKTKMTAVSKKYRNYYPQEVFDKMDVTKTLDLYMLAKMFIHLTGGDVASDKFSPTVPKQIAGLFRACLLGPNHRTSDVFELHKDFADALQIQYGKRTFRPFVLPTKS